VIHKREFKKLLGKTEREALSAWPRVNGEVEREIALARRKIASGGDTASMTELQAYQEARRRVSEMVAGGATEDDLSIAGDILADSFPRDDETGAPLGTSPLERHTINLLRNPPASATKLRPAFTLADAKRLYVSEHLGADPDQRILTRVDRVIRLATQALGRDPVLADLTREDARTVRDHMQSRLKSTGQPVSASSVRRELNDLKAIINFAVTDGQLPGFHNPFNRLQLAGDGRAVTEGEKRDPLPPKVLREVRKRVIGRGSDELSIIWRLLEGTGTRLGEVTGLRLEDVVLEGPIGGLFPHLKVAWHEERRVKTLASIRHVPLVGDALEAAKEALKLPRSGAMLFPTYGHERGSDGASAALMKHVRQITDNPKHVVHSLRHNMKDRLILAEVGSLDQNIILGHALGGVGDRVYGGGLAKLRMTTRAMRRAMGLPLVDTDQHPADTDNDDA
jgi:integrase